MQNTIKILLIEDSKFHAHIIRQELEKVGDINVQLSVHCAGDLQSGLAFLQQGGADVVLLDLVLPDSTGIDTFKYLHKNMPEIPIVIITSISDQNLALQAVKLGAQDYLLKGNIESNLLIRSIRYAIERHRLLLMVQGLSLVDELTGLYNRRGLLTLGEQQIKLSKRTRENIYLFFLDIDKLKIINDNFGHQEGDVAIVETANILKATFRETDVIARMGGDEFAIIVKSSDQHILELLTKRLENNINIYNNKVIKPYPLEISFGIAQCEITETFTINELITKADMEMYKQKRAKK